MVRRRLSRASGFVHDIDMLETLSDEPRNARLLSDRTLYILQNLSLEDVTFLSRYGEPVGGDFYIPVASGEPGAVLVNEAVDSIRRDLNDMSIEELLECICETNQALVAQGAAAGGAIGAIASDGAVETGDGQQFPDQDAYFDAKCNVANAIYDTTLNMVDWLDDNMGDLAGGVFGGITSGLLVGMDLAGPMGWAWSVAGGVLSSVASYIISISINFSDLSAALVDTHDECVLALFNASGTLVAENSFLAAVNAGSPSISVVEERLLRILLQPDLLNNLYFPRSDIVAYASPSPVVCGSGLLQAWTFAASGESWAFRDDSTGTYSAAGSWEVSLEAWQVELTGVGTGAGPRAAGTVYITGLSIAVPAGGSIQLDHSATSDGVGMGRTIKAVFSDVTEQEEIGGPSSAAGTLVMTIPTAKTINELEITYSRNWSFAFIETRDIQEVRVVGL